MLSSYSQIKAKSETQGMPLIIPIPGATTVERVVENLTDVELSANDVKEIDSILASIPMIGDRYPGHTAKFNFGNSPPLKE